MFEDWFLANLPSLNTQQVGGIATTILGGLSIGAGIAMIATGAGIPAGIGAIGAGLGMGFSGYSSIRSTIDQKEQHLKIPNSSVGLASGGDINFGKGTNGFFFYQYSIKKEFAEIIDNHFSMYGYQVNSLEVPNLHTRTYWNFLKLLDPNIEGANIPEKDINLYKAQLKAGLTFWHDPTHFRDYSQTNSVIT